MKMRPSHLLKEAMKRGFKHHQYQEILGRLHRACWPGELVLRSEAGCCEDGCECGRSGANAASPSTLDGGDVVSDDQQHQLFGRSPTGSPSGEPDLEPGDMQEFFCFESVDDVPMS
eukprot:5112527-Pyramimonas_sp.AAC.1